MVLLLFKCHVDSVIGPAASGADHNELKWIYCLDDTIFYYCKGISTFKSMFFFKYVFSIYVYNQYIPRSLFDKCWIRARTIISQTIVFKVLKKWRLLNWLHRRFVQSFAARRQLQKKKLNCEVCWCQQRVFISIFAGNLSRFRARQRRRRQRLKYLERASVLCEKYSRRQITGVKLLRP